MSHTRPILSLSCLTVALAFALAACGTASAAEGRHAIAGATPVRSRTPDGTAGSAPSRSAALPKQGGDPRPHIKA